MVSNGLMTLLVLALIMLSSEDLDHCVDNLTPHQFHHHSHSQRFHYHLSSLTFVTFVLGSLHGVVAVACMEKDGEVEMKRHHGSEVCTNVAHHLIMLFLIRLKSLLRIHFLPLEVELDPKGLFPAFVPETPFGGLENT